MNTDNHIMEAEKKLKDKGVLIYVEPTGYMAITGLEITLIIDGVQYLHKLENQELDSFIGESCQGMLDNLMK